MRGEAISAEAASLGTATPCRPEPRAASPHSDARHGCHNAGAVRDVLGGAGATFIGETEDASRTRAVAGLTRQPKHMLRLRSLDDAMRGNRAS